MRFRTSELYLKRRKEKKKGRRKLGIAKFRLERKDKISRNRRKNKKQKKGGSDDVVNGETVVRGLLDGLPINYVIVRMDGSEIASESAREDRFYNKKKKKENKKLW